MNIAGSQPFSQCQRQGVWLVLLLSAIIGCAAPLTVVDRIGADSTRTDFQPGGAIMRYTGHWTNGGACGTLWTQPFDGTLAEVAFALFARQVNSSNGLYLAPVTNLSAFNFEVHLWTNGAAGFLDGSNALRGDVVLPLGPGPSAPVLFGLTAITNSVINSTNLFISQFPTIRFATNLAQCGVRLERGREYALALVLVGESGNIVVRHCFASAAGTPDVLARWTATDGLVAGYATNVPALSQFATSIQVEPDQPPVLLSIARRENLIELSWPDVSGQSGGSELWRATNLLGAPWEPVSGTSNTNLFTLPNVGGEQYFRLMPAAPSSPAPKAVAKLVSGAAAPTSNAPATRPLTWVTDPWSGLTTYLVADRAGLAGGTTPAQARVTAARRKDPVQVARAFLQERAAAFGVSVDELQVEQTETDQLGMRHVRYGQRYQGVPVYGVELRVHLTQQDGVASVNGRLAPIRKPILTAPVISEAAAAVLGRIAWQTGFVTSKEPVAQTKGLCILAPEFTGWTPELHKLGAGNVPRYLVWLVEVHVADSAACASCGPIPMRYLVDATDGSIRESIEMVRGLYRKIYDCGLYPQTSYCESEYTTNLFGVTYTYGRREGRPPRGPSPQPEFLGSLDVDTLYDLMGSVHEYYLTTFNRDGANGLGGCRKDYPTNTHGSVHINAYPPNAGACPNAAFFYDTGSIGFCPGMVTPNVVGHEYAHAVSYYTHGAGDCEWGQCWGMMDRGGEPRALDESSSDFFGEMLELRLTGTNDWLHGTGSPALTSWGGRDLADPLGTPHPRAMAQGYLYYPDRYYSGGFPACDTSELAGYMAMAVMNKASYLLTVGGWFNGVSISGVGAAKAEQILYRAMVNYYATNERFNNAYHSILQACADLYSADDCRQVRRALQAVEIDQPDPCSGLPASVPDALDLIGW